MKKYICCVGELTAQTEDEEARKAKEQIPHRNSGGDSRRNRELQD